MNNTLILDANFLCSLINTADVNHPKAEEIFESLSEQSTLCIPLIVGVELSILAKPRQNLISQALDQFLAEFEVDVLPFSSEQLPDMKSFVRETNFSLKPNDYALLFATFQENALLLTFDKQLRRAAENLDILYA